MTGPPKLSLRDRERPLGIGDLSPIVFLSHEQRLDCVHWAEAYQLRCVAWPRGQCVHWLTKGHCAWERAHPGLICRTEGDSLLVDHVSGWTRDGKPAVLVWQPYGVYPEDLAELARLAQQYSLGIHIDGTGWYGHGTTLIELWRSSDFRRLDGGQVWHGALNYHCSRQAARETGR